jgi:hypothetical protein
MMQCSQHTEIAVKVGEMETRQTRTEKDVDSLFDVHRKFSETTIASFEKFGNKVNKIGMRMAYFSGGIAAINIFILILIEIFKK